jgi:peroxiredoxin
MKSIKILFLICLFVLMLPGQGLAVLSDGDTAPDFTLMTTSGDEVTLSEFKGQVVILHFWKSN